MIIELSWEEIQYAANIGAARFVESRKLGLEGGQRFATAGYSDWSVDIDGAIAELAAAKALDSYWAGSVRSFRGPDLSGGMINIRSTRQKNGSLIIRPQDHGVFMLVINQMPSFHLPGFIRTEDVKINYKLSNPGNRDNGEAYFVPQRDLFPLSLLKEVKWNA